MPTASLRSPIGRALLTLPPGWGRLEGFAVTAWLLAAWLPATVGGGAAQQWHSHSHAMLPRPEA